MKSVLIGASLVVAATIAVNVVPASVDGDTWLGTASPWTTEVGGFSSISDIAPLSDDDIHAVGSRLIHSDGEWWRAVEQPSTSTKYRAVSFASGEEGWAVGRGFAVPYSDGAWQASVSLPDYSFRDVQVVGPDAGWAVGWTGATQLAAIWHLSSGEWLQVEVAGDLPTVFESVWMASDDEGWAAGGDTIAHYHGGTWTGTAMSEWGSLHSVSGTGEDNVWAVGGPEPLPFIDPGPARILHYDGRHWSQVHDAPLGGLVDIAVRGDEAYAVGYRSSGTGRDSRESQWCQTAWGGH
jgi:hypothetical protein